MTARIDDYSWDWMTAEREDAIRQYCLNTYKTRFKKGIHMVEAKDGFVEIWGLTNGPLYLSATFCRDLKLKQK